jgi:hypothetical protein
MFGFRALDEHKQLDVSQFSISVDTNGNKELHYSGESDTFITAFIHQRFSVKPAFPWNMLQIFIKNLYNTSWIRRITFLSNTFHIKMYCKGF